MIDSLNRQYAIDGHVVFTGAQGGMVKAEVSNSLATAQVYLHGAHITAFQPHTTEQPLLWMSGRTMLQPGKAIRGGIPICWPWFGPHPDDSSKPQHGYARISPWTMMSSAALEDGSTQLRLRMNADAPARGPWPDDAVELELCVTVGSRLRIELISRNRHSEIVTIGSALHSYFNIGDIDRVSVAGLDGRDYLDQPDQYR